MPADKKTQCSEDLCRRILTQEIAPGSDLDEAALCAQYGLSRTPMREIFQRLSGEGYLHLEQNRGARVSPMDLATLRVFFQTAPMIYANIARQAAKNRRRIQIEPLRQIQAGFRAATEGGETGKAAMLNHRFHQQIGDMAHNPYLLPSLKRMLIDHTRLSQTFYRPASEDDQQRIIKACVQHDEMIIAIERQEPTMAVELTLAHWDLARDRLERFVTPDPLPMDVVSLKDRRHVV